MSVSKGDRKPIAVLCKEAPAGFQYMLAALRDNVDEYNFPRGEIIDKEGQRYFIVDREEQLMGMEISDFRISPEFFFRNPNAEAIVRRVKERIR